MAEGVVGQCGQADHSVVSDQFVSSGLPDVARRPRAGALRRRTEVASLIQPDIKPIDLVSCPAQERNQNGSDVAAITRDEDPHRQLPDCLETRCRRW